MSKIITGQSARLPPREVLVVRGQLQRQGERPVQPGRDLRGQHSAGDVREFSPRVDVGQHETPDRRPRFGRDNTRLLQQQGTAAVFEEGVGAVLEEEVVSHTGQATVTVGSAATRPKMNVF
jgi:hypothetical protein